MYLASSCSGAYLKLNPKLRMPVCKYSYCPEGAVHFNGAEMCQLCDLKVF